MRFDSEEEADVPDDPVQLWREWLGYEPFEYMHPFIRNDSHFIANVQARQTGKTFNGMSKLIYYALSIPGSLILITRARGHFREKENLFVTIITFF